MTRLFIDSSDLRDIEWAFETGLVRGVTTNPLILGSSTGYTNILEFVDEACAASKGRLDHVSIELGPDPLDWPYDADFLSVSSVVVLKVPCTAEGLKFTATAAMPVNMTAVMSASQAMLANAAGADYISIFSGRIRDTGGDPAKVIRESRALMGTSAELIVGSIRHPSDVTEAALAGADIVTVPPAILRKMLQHPGTDKVLTEFNAAWRPLRANKERS